MVLGLESSCDETAAAVVLRHPDGRGEILSNVVRSQIDEHRLYGGVVPELAARAHVAHMDHIVRRALGEAGVRLADLDGIAATAGPGLIGGVLVGLTTGKALAVASGKAFVAINHLEAHALTARLTDGASFPYLMLLVSGGHTQFVLVEGLGAYRKLGGTIDDALGEAFDKVAKMLGLGYPGGPEVERAALSGDATRFQFPKPLMGEDRLDFSFSGLKTAVRLAAERVSPLGEQDIADISASFQATVAGILARRTGQALQTLEVANKVLVVAGGVAANKVIGAALREATAAAGAQLIVPPPALCTDNGVMVAWAGLERLTAGHMDGLDFPARARWPLDDAAMAVHHG
ncbi:MAG: tRNA (adenosine(37)-N6)-threonylcarbamoyltransferase complex transferase subunit TsaD [Hyphomicrobiaceae bacterium]|nr:tRNA (adenosine(37)-N6)-threonylcarbamoyltransferase complex transferase subunit TsaD [Hyphomicrobiaceae bacterium]